MSEMDPELLAALTGLLARSGDEAPKKEEEPEEEKVPEVSRSLYERLAELERKVN